MWYPIVQGVKRLHHATCGLVKTSTKPYLFSNIVNTCIHMLQLLSFRENIIA